MSGDALFKAHLENTRALDGAFDLVAKQCRAAIARGDSETTELLTKTCGFLLGARMENRLFRLVHEPGAFDEGQRRRILAAQSIQSSWETLIEEAYASRRGLGPHQIPQQLSFTDRARYNELIRVVREELAPMITLRNVLGHGQWHRALDADRKQISPDRTRLVKTTRLWHLNIRANLLDQLVWLVHDLAVTAGAFERDFDKRWSRLMSAKARLERDNFGAYEASLRRQRANSLANRPHESYLKSRSPGCRFDASALFTRTRSLLARFVARQSDSSPS